MDEEEKVRASDACCPRFQEIPSYPFREFIADVGGTMGLFLGLSFHGISCAVISVVELSYKKRR